MNNAVFAKTMEIVRQKKLFGVTNKLSYNRIFLWKFISHRNEKKQQKTKKKNKTKQTLMNKSVCLGLSF